ncbi:hypothetical protein MMC10_000235 [Thelotrema lepadinum]|nr:hypothetical protein [Thelotrema lepadinum]
MALATLTWLGDWSPFRLDALGIVTLLGAEEVNRAIGRLISSPVTDYLPLLGAFVAAGDNISDPIPGFRLYNIRDGIVAQDVAPWFARWLQTATVTWNATFLSINIIKPRQRSINNLLSMSLGFVVLGAIVVICVLTGDWWGLANASSMLISVLVRAFMVQEQAVGLPQKWESVQDETWATEVVKVLVIMPGGEAIATYVPRGILTEAMLSAIKPPRPRLYYAARVIGWIGFGCHVVTLGMTILLNQLISIAVLLLSTLLFTYGVGADYHLVANCVRIRRFDETKGFPSRSRVYLRLDLTVSEEDTLIGWGIMPQRSNKDWWQLFRSRGAETSPAAFIAWRDALLKKRPEPSSKKV